MRNYYPLPRPITNEVPYTVKVVLLDGSGYEEDFPTYGEAQHYYETLQTITLRAIKSAHLAPTPAWKLEN